MSHLCRHRAAPASSIVVKRYNRRPAFVVPQKGIAGSEFPVNVVSGRPPDQMDIKVSNGFPLVSISNHHVWYLLLGSSDLFRNCSVSNSLSITTVDYDLNRDSNRTKKRLVELFFLTKTKHPKSYVNMV